MNYMTFRDQLTRRGWVLGNDSIWRSPASQQLHGIGVSDSEIANVTSAHGDLLHTMIFAQIDVGAKGWSLTVTQNGLQIQTNLATFF